jgi:hypothetical protein
MPLIIPANSITGGFAVDNSLRFNSGSSDYLNRTQEAATDRKKFTFSVWVKICGLTGYRYIYSSYNDANNRLGFYIHTTYGFTIYDKQTSDVVLQINNALARDVSAWYNYVVKGDSTESLQADRIKVWVNGELVTSFQGDSVNNIGLNDNFAFGTTSFNSYVGVYEGSNYFQNGYLSEMCFLDGQALDATSFGEFDEDSGIWKPIDVSGLTFGDAGFYLDFKNSGSLGADVSGNGNNFTVNNLTSIDQTTDTPTNNYCTMNPLFNPDPSNPLGSISNGNLSFTTNSTSLSSMGVTTFGASSGKYYAEIKLTGESGSGEAFAGIGYDIYENATSSFNAESSFMWNVCSNGDAKFGGSAQGVGNWSNTYTTNDIISIALDLDNNRVYFAKNGQYADGSGNWDESFTGSPAYATITADKSYFFCAGDKSSSQTASWSCNFGNPPYTISSGNSDGNGMGNFEYSVPSGYYALNTKNLAEYG